MSADQEGSPFLPARISSGRSALWVASVALVYFAAARLSLSLIVQPEGITAVWPPDGIFLAAVLLTRRSVRPWLVGVLFITDVIAEVLAGTSFAVSIVYACALTGDAVLSSWLLLRFVGSPIRFSRARDVFGFLGLAVVLSNVLLSSVAAAASWWNEGASFWNSWKWWAAANGVGDLLVTPLILSWASLARTGLGTWSARRILEAAALFVPLIVLNFVAFTRVAEHDQFPLFLAYLTVPFLLWAAVRFGVRGVTLALVILAAIVLHFTVAGRVTGISHRYSRLDAVVIAQLYLAIIAVPSLLLAAVVAERQQSHDALRRQARRLQVLAHAGREINSVLVLPEVMRRLVAAAMELTSATGGTAGQMLDGQMVFAEYNQGGTLLPISYRFDPDYGVPGWVMQTHAPYLSADAEHDPHVIPEIQKALGFHTLIDIPILSREGALLGCFELHNRADHQPFDENDVELLSGLAANAAVAIANARLLAERQAAEAEAAWANRVKDEFLAKLSHELRTPLTPALLATAQWGPHAHLPAALRDDMAMIRRNLELEARLLDDLLDINRILHGKLTLRREVVDVHQQITQALAIVAANIQARRLQLSVRLQAAHSRVDGDPARVQQLIWNLLGNAIKFTPEGGGLAVSTANDPQGQILLRIADTGVGIEPDVLPRIFEAFEQGDSRMTRQFGGLGLGLTIAKALVDMHGGAIEAHSEGKGKGTTFAVRLPLCDVPAAAAEHKPPSDKPEPRHAARSLQILLVEDNEDTARITRRLLEANGHGVEIAADVATALRLAGEREFDLILSDLGLPDGSGLDLMRTLRARGSTLPGIALSGYGTEQDLVQTREAGFAAHLTKPTSLPQLEDAIAAVTR